MPKLRDVALAAECSISTASRSLSGDRRVAVATRQRVQDAADLVGYRWNGRTRLQNKPSNRLVGLVIPDLDKYNYAAGASLLHDVLSTNGYQIVLVCHHDDPARDKSAISTLADLGVTGIIHVPCGPRSAKELLGANAEIPVVELNRRSSSTNIDAVIADELSAGYEVARHLIELGHRRIAMLTGSLTLSTIRDRHNGFKHAIEEASLELNHCPILTGPTSSKWGFEGTAQLMDRPARTRPTAIFAASALISLGSVVYLNSNLIKVPEDVSIVGFSDPEWYAACSPPMTTYEVPLLEMGHMAAQVLLNQLQPQVDVRLKPTVVRHVGRLLVRSSTAKPRST